MDKHNVHLNIPYYLKDTSSYKNIVVSGVVIGKVISMENDGYRAYLVRPEKIDGKRLEFPFLIAHGKTEIVAVNTLFQGLVDVLLKKYISGSLTSPRK